MRHVLFTIPRLSTPALIGIYHRLSTMPKHERTDSSCKSTSTSSKKLKVVSAPPAFSPIKVASKQNADTADLNPPFQQLLLAMRNTVSTPLKSDCVVFWMRMTDLRVKDNRALARASQQAASDGVPLVALFVVSPQDFVAHDRSSRKIDFTLRNLVSIKCRLAELHIPLHVATLPRRKTVVSEVIIFLDSIGCNHVFANIEYEVDELRRDIELCSKAREISKQVSLYHNKSVVEPGIIQSKGGKGYAVYSPYARQWVSIVNSHLSDYLEEAQDPAPNGAAVRSCPKIGPLFLSEIPSYVEGFVLDPEDSMIMRELWPEGEDAASQILQRFLQTKARASQLEARGPLNEGVTYDVKHNRISKYHTDRDRADKDTTSRLSPYLSSGVISIREVLRAILKVTGAQQLNTDSKTGAGRFISELAWRDFYTDVLASYPRISMGRPFLEKYSGIIWENHQAPANSKDPAGTEMDAEALFRWKRGTTGVPIVDAAMRCLNKMGWVHNRMRMIVAMYLTKHLMIDWRVGERYFMQTLVDGDLASNNGGWQWSASTGVDPCPYFRIFNPHTQSLKVQADPTGDFIRHWVPELRNLRGLDLHNPTSSIANNLGYPLPIIEHKEGRERALRRFKQPGEK
ncbi:photolyase [Coprinopsis cinerea AmutBmut pab1-1]|nr:photolyase [Coprinopsis cinerea AmutBmut pab1-1]